MALVSLGGWVLLAENSRNGGAELALGGLAPLEAWGAPGLRKTEMQDITAPRGVSHAVRSHTLLKGFKSGA